MKDMPVADLRRLEIDATPDPAFVARSLAAITVDVRDARRRDASFLGRLRRRIGSLNAAVGPDTDALRALRLPLLVLLLLALLYAALVVAGSLLRPPSISGGNGPAVAVVEDTLSAIDMTDGTRRDLLPPGTEAAGVSRSTDGTLVSFWTEGGSRLEVIRIDGTDQRQLATAMTVKGARCFDVWSADSRELAAEVLDAGIQRILVVNVATGDARFVTEPSLAAGCPLWSPDGRSLALAYSRRSGTRGVGIVGADGTGFHESVAPSKGGRHRERTAGRRTGSGSTSRREEGRPRQALPSQRHWPVQRSGHGTRDVGVRSGALARRQPGLVHRRPIWHLRPLRGARRRRGCPHRPCRMPAMRAGRRTARPS